jgi:c-di-GMP-binding flagellar brake protein YcgR
MGEPQFEKRRCKRLKLKEQCTVQIDHHTIEVKLLELSPTGALIECENGVKFLEKEKLKLSVCPDNSEVLMHFEGEVVYCHENQIGVRFSPITA